MRRHRNSWWMGSSYLQPERFWLQLIDFITHPHSSEWIIGRCLLTYKRTCWGPQGVDSVERSAKSNSQFKWEEYSCFLVTLRSLRAELHQIRSMMRFLVVVSLKGTERVPRGRDLALVSRKYLRGLNVHFIWNNSKIALRRQKRDETPTVTSAMRRIALRSNENKTKTLCLDKVSW